MPDKTDTELKPFMETYRELQQTLAERDSEIAAFKRKGQYVCSKHMFTIPENVPCPYCSSEAAESRLAEVMGVLREHEWSVRKFCLTTWVNFCPICGAQKGLVGHDADCWLAALLKEQTK